MEWWPKTFAQYCMRVRLRACVRACMPVRACVCLSPWVILLVVIAGEHCASGSGEACIPVSDDALFRDKLKHMGKCEFVN